jgi:hypothetical protein
MPIDLSYSPEVLGLVKQTEAFTNDVVLPVEDEHNGDTRRPAATMSGPCCRRLPRLPGCSRRTHRSSAAATA